MSIATAPARGAVPTLDIAAIESITGLAGSFDPAENVFRISERRTDRRVFPSVVADASVAAFTPAAGGTRVVGKTVLLEDEVSPALSAALDGGLEVTALHRRVVFDRPPMYVMQIVGSGDGRRMASAIRAIHDRIEEVRAANAVPQRPFEGTVTMPGRIAGAPIEAVFGTAVHSASGMVGIGTGRTAWLHGIEIGSEMDIETRIAFAGSDSDAVVEGDIAMIESDLQGVLKALRGGAVDVVAIDRRMTGETPSFVFVHFRGRGVAVDLARTVKKAIDTQQPDRYD